MIVTCPGCTSNYRVRNESVPAQGARMKCPTCATMFLAKRPVSSSDAPAVPAAVPAPVPVAGLGAPPPQASFPAVPNSAPVAPSLGAAPASTLMAFPAVPTSAAPSAPAIPAPTPPPPVATGSWQDPFAPPQPQSAAAPVASSHAAGGPAATFLSFPAVPSTTSPLPPGSAAPSSPPSFSTSPPAASPPASPATTQMAFPAVAPTPAAAPNNPAATANPASTLMAFPAVAPTPMAATPTTPPIQPANPAAASTLMNFPAVPATSTTAPPTAAAPVVAPTPPPDFAEPVEDPDMGGLFSSNSDFSPSEMTDDDPSGLSLEMDRGDINKRIAQAARSTQGDTSGPTSTAPAALDIRDGAGFGPSTDDDDNASEHGSNRASIDLPPPIIDRSPPAGPSMVARAGSFVFALLGSLVLLVGATFALWGFSIVPLDDVLGPVFEDAFSVVPAVSPTGKDRTPLTSLIDDAKSAAIRGDSESELLLWMQIRSRDVDNEEAKTKVEALSKKLHLRK